jgi:polysaccharide biosynthesis protein PslJ
VGTQGQVLYLVFSHGYPGLLLFLAWLGHAFFRSARPRAPAALAGHVCLLIALVQAPFYGLLTQMVVIAAAAALAIRGNAPARTTAVAKRPAAPSWSATRPLAGAVRA